MIGAGTIINPIIKIVTTVAILGAVYLFFVKPALDTTKEISDTAFDSSRSIQQEIRDDVRDSLGDFNVNFQVPDSTKQAQKLGDCVSAAAPDVDAVRRCVERFSQ